KKPIIAIAPILCLLTLLSTSFTTLDSSPIISPNETILSRNTIASSNKIEVNGESINEKILVNITHTPVYPQPNQRVIIRVQIGNSSIAVKRVLLSYRERLNYNWYGVHQYWDIYEWTWEPLTWNVYTDWVNVTMIKVEENVYEAVIPELPYYTIVWYQVQIINGSNRLITLEVKSYCVVRGTEYIIYSQASNIVSRVLYVAVALALIYGLIRGSTSESKEVDEVGKQRV
ncbi:MAG: hypothetical protein QXU67_05475, partial [Candidatus Bathyarchaeia archaeon]